MKKLVLFAVTALIASAAHAQKAKPAATNVNAINPYAENSALPATGRTTATGDTFKLANITASDTLVAYNTVAGGGYTTGTNSYGDRGFAERYSFNASDSSMKVIGVFAQFTGRVSSATAKSVNLKVWNSGPQAMITGSLFYSGFPALLMNSKTVPLTQLGIGNGALPDTMKKYMFDTVAVPVLGAFFVGYDINYSYSALAGDTIGLACSKKNHRTSAKYWLTYALNADGDTLATDTVINVQNATQWSDNRWHDNYTDNDSLFNDLAIYPIVVIGGTTGLSSVTKNDLTFYGSYPNPASDKVNIRFALANRADVTIQIMDINGRVVNTIKESALTTGEHTVSLATATMPSGEYLYIIRTSAGDGVAGNMSVIK